MTDVRKVECLTDRIQSVLYHDVLEIMSRVVVFITTQGAPGKSLITVTYLAGRDHLILTLSDFQWNPILITVSHYFIVLEISVESFRASFQLKTSTFNYYLFYTYGEFCLKYIYLNTFYYFKRGCVYIFHFLTYFILKISLFVILIQPIKFQTVNQVK